MILVVTQTGFEPVTLACKALPICRLPSLTWESGFPCHSLNRRVSYVVVVSLGGQSSAASRTAYCLRVHFIVSADLGVPSSEAVCAAFE